MKRQSNLGKRFKQLQNRSVTCAVCGADDVQIHHIVPLGSGGSNDPENLIALCRAHHARATALFASGRGEYYGPRTPEELAVTLADPERYRAKQRAALAAVVSSAMEPEPSARVVSAVWAGPRIRTF